MKRTGAAEFTEYLAKDLEYNTYKELFEMF